MTNLHVDTGEVKVCRKCTSEKPFSEFPVDNRNRDGLASYCRSCGNELSRQWKLRRGEKSLEQKAADAAYQEAYYTENHAAVREQQRDSRLRARYGITADEYDAMLDKQGGVCAICGSPPRGQKRLHVDHDHETGVVRGLLCHVCNVWLGILEKAEWRAKAEEYLDQ